MSQMARGVTRSIRARFDEEIRFFKGWVDKPKEVGAIIPTGAVAAARMASVIDVGSGRPVLELGPGTGCVTKAILATGLAPEKLFSIEFSPDFVRHLRRDFPQVRIIEGDAFDLDEALDEANGTIFDSVVSAVPLLNFPPDKRVAYVESLLDRIPAGRPVVQISYGPKSPVPPKRGSYRIEHLDFVMRNIPPAQLWVYRRKAS